MENLILSNLLENEKYARKVLPHLKPEYFQSIEEKTVFGLVHSFVEKYNSFPTKEALYIELSNLDTINEQVFSESQNLIHSLQVDPSTKTEWLVDQTEKFCQEKAVFNAIAQSIQIIDGKTDKTKNAIPEILQDALSISFDSSIGHDFLDDSEERWDLYHAYQNKVPTGIHYIDTITNGGFPDKSLNIFIAATGVGKSFLMCACAANNLRMQKNVLYITLEMAEERIAQRIDANLLDITLDDLMELPRDKYNEKMERLKDTCKGKLIIKEYPTATANAAHFRNLLNDLRLKKNFIPDIIYIDYLNICTSSRMKMGGSVNSYGYIKAIAEELRGLSCEYTPPIVSATQANRDALSSSDMDLSNTSESLGLPMTVDFMLALISTEELEEEGMLLCKQLKNRYGDPAKNRRFVIGTNKAKMQVYDVKKNEQPDLLDGPEDEAEESNYTPINTTRKFDKQKFKGFQ